jgi:hypothetical protein
MPDARLAGLPIFRSVGPGGDPGVARVEKLWGNVRLAGIMSTNQLITEGRPGYQSRAVVERGEFLRVSPSGCVMSAASCAVRAASCAVLRGLARLGPALPRADRSAGWRRFPAPDNWLARGALSAH